MLVKLDLVSNQYILLAFTYNIGLADHKMADT